MRDALDDQIEAYDEQLADLRRVYGKTWVLMVNRRLVSTFREFADAARYADQHHGDVQVLIRHTFEAERETAPFLYLHA